MSSFYLASQSPRRRELLTQIGVRFELIDAVVDETPRPDEQPEDYVLRMARSKAAAGAARVAAGAIVLGADTAVVAGGRILGKPGDREEGLQMLRQLAGGEHYVFSGVCLCSGERESAVLSQTCVRFRPISEIELEQYWDSGEPADKAGAYAIQGLGAVFVEHLSGSYSGVVGLPLFETARLLQEFGVPCGLKHE